jgi:phosphate-selective porin OprO/OprP
MATGFLLGGAVSAHGETWTAAMGFFQEPIDDEEDRKETEGDGVTGRVTFLPWQDDDMLIHLGVGLEARDLDSGSGFRLRTRPEAALAASRLLDTGTLANVDQFTTLNLEGAWRDGPFSLQGQYLHMFTDRAAAIPDAEFKGWYAQASWIVTGEQRDYSKSSGVFTTVEPEEDFGAVEVAVRYSTLDLEDETVNGGEETNVTLGINWYVTDYMRLMANFIHAELDPNRSGTDEDVQIGQARLQLNM